MATINKISPDNGATVYDIETKWGNVSGTLSDQTDLQTALDAKYNIATANLAGAKNLLSPEIIGLLQTSTTLGANTFIENANVTSFIGKLEHNTDYILTRQGGNRFNVMVSMNYPTIGGACNLLVVNNPTDSYTFNSGAYNYVLFFTNNTLLTVDDVKPMLRLATDTDSTYAPYAMTNKQLTDMVSVTESAVTDIVSGASVSENRNYLYKVGRVVQCQVQLQGVTATAWSTNVFKIPDGFRPIVDNRFNDLLATSTRISVQSDGNVVVSASKSNESLLLNATWITS